MRLYSHITNKNIHLPAIVADWKDGWTQSPNSRLAQPIGHGFQEDYLTPWVKQKPVNESRYGKNKNIDMVKVMK